MYKFTMKNVLEKKAISEKDFKRVQRRLLSGVKI
jgi:hypothetical protein